MKSYFDFQALGSDHSDNPTTIQLVSALLADVPVAAARPGYFRHFFAII